MSYVVDILKHVNNLKLESEHLFSGSCPNCPKKTCHLNIILDENSSGVRWRGNFRCREGCSKEKILSHLGMNRCHIFERADSRWIEYDPETYYCLFSDEEAKAMLIDLVSQVHYALQKPDNEKEKVFEGINLWLTYDAILWLDEIGKHRFADKKSKSLVDIDSVTPDNIQNENGSQYF